MGRKSERQSFADVVRDVREQPATPAPELGGVIDPEGLRWQQSKSSISEAQARALADAGGRVAWDPCGCGGYCGFTWFGPEEIARMIAAGTPTVRNSKRRRGNISEWTADDGRVLVVAEDAVRWADLLA